MKVLHYCKYKAFHFYKHESSYNIILNIKNNIIFSRMNHCIILFFLLIK